MKAVRAFIKHHRKLAIGVSIAGSAGIAFAIWAGILTIPFTGSTGEAVQPLETTTTLITAADLVPILDPPVYTAPEAESFAYPASNTITLTNNSGVSVSGWTMAFVADAGMPADMMTNVHVRIAVGAVNNGSPGTFDFDTTLQDLSTTPWTGYSGGISDTGYQTVKLVLWLDQDAPESLASQSFTGNVVFTTLP